MEQAHGGKVHDLCIPKENSQQRSKCNMKGGYGGRQEKPVVEREMRLTPEYTFTLVISISVYSPGMVSVFERDRSGWTSFSSRSAPSMAISLSKANGVGPRRRCGT